MATIPRLFVQADLSTKNVIPLTPEQSHYLGKVLRKEAGMELLVFNGRDGEWMANLETASKKGGTASVVEQTRPQSPSPDVMLYFAPVKRSPIDLIAQKATELGVAALAPVQTERTIVSRLREDRLLANAIEAAEQCERLEVPEIKPLQKLDKALSNWDEKRHLIFCDEAGHDAEKSWGGPAGRALPMAEALAAFKGQTAPWAILIGPEGGFSPAERERLRALPFVVPVTLGPRILRADTAAFAAITLWQAVLGDFTKA